MSAGTPSSGFVFDPMTTTAYRAATTPVARVQAVRDLLGRGTLTVELRDGEALKFSGTFAGPLVAGEDGSLSKDVLLSGTVSSGGMPNAETWTCRITNGARYIEGSFGPGGRFRSMRRGVLVAGQPLRLNIRMRDLGMARPAWLTEAPPMTWSTIPDTKLERLLVDPRGKASNRALVWCGAGLKHDGSEMFVATGGHGDGSSNAIYSIRLGDETPAWVRRNEPTPAELIVTDASRYLDGRPTSRHTYWNIQFNQSRNLLMFFGSAATYGTGGRHFPDVDAFDPVSNDYLPAGSFPPVPVAMGPDRPIVMDDQDNCYHQSSAGSAVISRWDNDTNTWTNLPGTRNTFQNNVPMVFDGSRGRLVRFDRTRPVIFPLPGAEQTIGPNYSGPAASSIGRRACAVVIPAIGSPLDDRYIVVRFNKTGQAPGEGVELYVVDPDTFEVSVAPIAGVKPVLHSASGVGSFYGRFTYVPGLNIIAFAERETRDVFFIPLV